ncbi:tetratricopeptide repeat protein [Streptomyces sp. V4I2]|uniref:tetratricopeptide repeat protein n=1 Tax=Streptomyces sp. V4I2 TaxID=3042280 RepID=UPI002780FD3A|nr:tetratricopeptide repeat protein [Streptomyces sp. V4I2]MDQ1047454.1 tetratricopeptide (TPR) repeat protein [Streptomyces sp. V4I2]
MSSHQLVRAEGGFAYGVIGADIHVFGDGLPVYVLENWRGRPESSAEWLLELPSRMLSARHEIVPFTGREQDLAELHRWRVSDRRLAARWLRAPGGQGKTRLAARFAEESIARGWKVVHAVHGPGSVLPPPGSQDLRIDGADGLLLIVDYADHWPLPHLTWLFSNALLHRPELPTRVLMLARSADMWPAVRAALADLQTATSSQTLEPLSDESDESGEGSDEDGGPGQRGEMFRAARDGFAARHGVSDVAQLRPPVSLAEPDFGLTLTVHMAALVAVDAHRTGRRPPSDAAGLTTYLLDREQLHWARLHSQGAGREPGASARAHTTPPEVMNRAVFTAVLTGAVEHPTGATVLESLRVPLPAEQILADHAVCYPAADPVHPTVLEPLAPDRLAEDFLALTLPGHRADYPAQDWAAPTLQALLPHGSDRHTAAWTPRAMTFLASAADRWPHLRHGHLYPLLQGAPWLAVAAGGAALGLLVGLDDIGTELLEAVETELPDHEDAELDPAAAVLAVRLAEHRLATTDDPATQATVHLNLGWSLGGAGRYEESLAACERAVELFAQLAQHNPSAYERDLARALNNLSNRLDHLRQSQRALETAQRAVEIQRRLAAADPGAHSADLALSLSNYGVRLRHGGRWLEALQADGEALELYARLSAAHSGAYDHDLGVTLLNLGSGLSDALESPAAIAATRQAVAILGRPAENGTRAREGVLSTALANLATELREHGTRREQLVTRMIADGSPLDPDLLEPMHWRDEALAAITRAVEIDRRHAKANPAALESRLASSLHTQGQVLKDLGRSQDAQTSTLEAEALRARLGPLAEPHRAESRTQYGRESMVIKNEVLITLYRYLADVDVVAHGPELAMRLGLRYLNNPAGGPCDPVWRAEAAEVHRRLADADPDTYEPGYSYALAEYADALWWAGRRTESIEVTEQAVEIDRRLAAFDPPEYGPALTRTLDALATRLKATGRRRQARAVRRLGRRP